MEKSYTLTTRVHLSDETFELNFLTLKKIDFPFKLPFSLSLIKGQFFLAKKVLIFSPKQWLMAEGLFEDKPAVIKIFFNRYARLALKKSVADIKLLQDNAIPTPRIYYAGIAKDKRLHSLILEKIKGAENLATIWQNKKNIEDILPLLKAMTLELATQHVQGILPKQLNFNHFLLTTKKIYSLSGMKIKYFLKPLTHNLSIKNLAQFLAQLGANVEVYQTLLYQHYAKSRGWPINIKDQLLLSNHIKKWQSWFWQQREKEILSNNEHYALFKEKNCIGIYDRSYASQELLDMLGQPDAIFKQTGIEFLKTCHTSTVVKFSLNGRLLVIKRYNIRNTLHFLRRSLRATRAYECWRLAHKLISFGIPTAKPIAFIEHRRLGLRCHSYFIAEYISSMHIGDFFDQHELGSISAKNMIKKTAILLKKMFDLAMAHRDLKKTNILIHPHEEPYLIDLDGMTSYKNKFRFNAIKQKEIKRFLKNFNHQPEIYTAFQQEFNRMNE